MGSKTNRNPYALSVKMNRMQVILDKRQKERAKEADRQARAIVRSLT